MVYISAWQEYQEAAEALYDKSPNTVSYLFASTRAADERDLVIRRDIA